MPHFSTETVHFFCLATLSFSTRPPARGKAAKNRSDFSTNGYFYYLCTIADVSLTTNKLMNSIRKTHLLAKAACPNGLTLALCLMFLASGCSKGKVEKANDLLQTYPARLGEVTVLDSVMGYQYTVHRQRMIPAYLLIKPQTNNMI